MSVTSLKRFALSGPQRPLSVVTEQNTAGLDLALREKWVLGLVHPGGKRGEHVGHELGIGATGEGGGLSLLHLRRGDELHRLRDLAGVFDRLDASADVAC